MEALDQLNNKIDLLLKKHIAVQEENKRLRSTIEGQNKTIDTLSKKIRSLEHGVASLQIGKSLAATGDKEDVKKHLDAMIGEIDKIIMALND